MQTYGSIARDFEHAVVDDDKGLPELVDVPAAGRLEGSEDVLTLGVDAEDMVACWTSLLVS